MGDTSKVEREHLNWWLYHSVFISYFAAKCYETSDLKLKQAKPKLELETSEDQTGTWNEWSPTWT